MRAETLTVAGITRPEWVGYHGGDGRWWGLAETVADTWYAVAIDNEDRTSFDRGYALMRGFGTLDVSGGAWDLHAVRELSLDLAAYEAIMHFVQYRHAPTTAGTMCAVCEFAPTDDTDRLLAALNEVTSGGYWDYHEGGLFLLVDHETDHGVDQYDECAVECCAENWIDR